MNSTYDFGWWAQGAVDNIQMFRSDGSEGHRMGYGQGSAINDRRSISTAVKVRIGTADHYDGLITHITFVNADNQVVAGGET